MIKNSENKIENNNSYLNEYNDCKDKEIMNDINDKKNNALFENILVEGKKIEKELK